MVDIVDTLKHVGQEIRNNTLTELIIKIEKLYIFWKEVKSNPNIESKLVSLLERIHSFCEYRLAENNPALTDLRKDLLQLSKLQRTQLTDQIVEQLAETAVKYRLEHPTSSPALNEIYTKKKQLARQMAYEKASEKFGTFFESLESSQK